MTEILTYGLAVSASFFVGFLCGALMRSSAKREAAWRRSLWEAERDAGFPPGSSLMKMEMADGTIHEYVKTAEGECEWIKTK